jgi:hypothetical protein
MNAQHRLWTQWIIMALVACLAVFVWEAVSDEPPVAVPPHKVPVAVIDIGKIYLEHRQFNEEMLKIKGQIEEFEMEVRKRQKEIDALNPGDQGSSPPSGSDAEKAEKLRVALQAEIAAKRTEFLNIEARLYFEVYQSIQEETDKLCRDRDIGLVLRHDGAPMNPADRASVLRGVNQAVVYSDVPNLTNDLLAAFNGPQL